MQYFRLLLYTRLGRKTETIKALQLIIGTGFYDGNASPVHRLLDITDRLKKTPEVRIIQINPFRAFSSGRDTIENVLGTFQQWQEAHDHLVRK